MLSGVACWLERCGITYTVYAMNVFTYSRSSVSVHIGNLLYSIVVQYIRGWKCVLRSGVCDHEWTLKKNSRSVLVVQKSCCYACLMEQYCLEAFAVYFFLAWWCRRLLT